MTPSIHGDRRQGRGFSFDLPEPMVPAAPGGVLAPADAVEGVDVYLPEEVEFFPGDRVTVVFGDRGAWADLTSRVAHIDRLRGEIGKDIEVFYRLERDGETYPSERLPLRVAPLADQDPLMPAPLIAEADGDIVDLRTFAGDATVIQSRWPFFEAEEYIWLAVQGTTLDGSLQEIRLVDRYVNGGDEQGLTVALPRAFLAALPDGSELVVETRVRLSFDFGDPGVLFPLRVYTLVVDGTTPGLLPPPWVAEAVRDFIDPFSVPNGATACVGAFPMIVPGTSVTLFMHGTTLGGVPVGHEASVDIREDTPFPLAFIIPHEKIFVLGGSTADFGYFVDIPGADPLPSSLRTYCIVSTVPSLPPPRVPRAEGDWLDPETIDEHEGVEVDITYPGIAHEDLVTLTWRGTGSPDIYTDSITVFADSVSFFVPKERHLTPHIGAEVGLQYVARLVTGGSARSHPLVLKIGPIPRPELFIDFEDVEEQSILPGQELPLADAAVILSTERGGAGIAVQPSDYGEYGSHHVVLVSPLSTVAFALLRPARFIQIGMGNQLPLDIRLYDEQGNMVFEEGDGAVGGRYFTHESATPIAVIKITPVGFAQLDHITLR